MKIQCNACEMAEATVVCCADEAALCRACDEKVHAANKLARKHQRVPLSRSSSHMPKCDVCQEAGGYFFCLEDRALLCRKCDVAIHTANAYVSGHQRFLLTGVRVGLEPTEPVASSCKDKLNSTEKFKEKQSRSLSRKDASASLSSDNNDEVISSQAGGNGGLPVSRASFSGTMSGIIPEWPSEDALGMTDFSQNYGFFETGSSKADGSKPEDSEWSPMYRAAADDEVDIDECLSQVPEITWVVPDIPSPPTASGLHWPNKFEDGFLLDNSISVPDVCSLPSLHRYLPVNSKRQRHAQHVMPGSWV